MKVNGSSMIVDAADSLGFVTAMTKTGLWACPFNSQIKIKLLTVRSASLLTCNLQLLINKDGVYIYIYVIYVINHVYVLYTVILFV